MPAAAVIPAPIAYIKVVAVKKLVVGFLVWCARPVAARSRVLTCAHHPCMAPRSGLHWFGWSQATRIIYFEKIRVFKASESCEYISME